MASETQTILENEFATTTFTQSTNGFPIGLYKGFNYRTKFLSSEQIQTIRNEFYRSWDDEMPDEWGMKFMKWFLRQTNAQIENLLVLLAIEEI